MAAWLKKALRVRCSHSWTALVLLLLCCLVRTKAGKNSKDCSSVKSAYAAKGYNKNEVPQQMIAGKLIMITVVFIMVSRTCLVQEKKKQHQPTQLHPPSIFLHDFDTGDLMLYVLGQKSDDHDKNRIRIGRCVVDIDTTCCLHRFYFHRVQFIPEAAFCGCKIQGPVAGK